MYVMYWLLACIVSQLSVGIPTTFFHQFRIGTHNLTNRTIAPSNFPPLRSPYTIQDSNGIYRTANLDTTFNAARGFSITASFFGLLSFFTLGFASCCPIPQSR
jgi:hypothetical protein